MKKLFVAVAFISSFALPAIANPVLAPVAPIPPVKAISPMPALPSQGQNLLKTYRAIRSFVVNRAIVR